MKYYSNYYGHTIEDLTKVHKYFRLQQKNIIFLAGDSSLDNKYWLKNQYIDALNGYDKILTPKLMKQDICYHMNKKLAQNKQNYACINTAREESTISIHLNI